MTDTLKPTNLRTPNTHNKTPSISDKMRVHGFLFQINEHIRGLLLEFVVLMSIFEFQIHQFFDFGLQKSTQKL